MKTLKEIKEMMYEEMIEMRNLREMMYDEMREMREIVEIINEKKKNMKKMVNDLKKLARKESNEKLQPYLHILFN